VSEILQINPALVITLDEVTFSAVRAQGAGGQNVNKVSSAIHLQFDAPASSLPQACIDRILAHPDSRISAAGVITIKAQRFKSQPRNREDALERLAELINDCCRPRKARRATRPTLASRRRRREDKSHRSGLKAQRRLPKGGAEG